MVVNGAQQDVAHGKSRKNRHSHEEWLAEGQVKFHAPASNSGPIGNNLRFLGSCESTPDANGSDWRTGNSGHRSHHTSSQWWHPVLHRKQIQLGDSMLSEPNKLSILETRWSEAPWSASSKTWFECHRSWWWPLQGLLWILHIGQLPAGLFNQLGSKQFLSKFNTSQWKKCECQNMPNVLHVLLPKLLKQCRALPRLHLFSANLRQIARPDLGHSSILADLYQIHRKLLLGNSAAPFWKSRGHHVSLALKKDRYQWLATKIPAVYHEYHLVIIGYPLVI